MKLTNFEFFEPFNKLRHKMKADTLGSFSLNFKGQGLTKAELDILVSKGIDVGFEEINVLKDGTLAYKDSRVLIYIRDIPEYINQYNKEEISLPKFHLAWCSTLDSMRKKNKFGKYVVSTKTDGKFEICRIRNIEKKNSLEKLIVCRNCLRSISFENYDKVNQKNKDQIVNNFTIINFFENYPRQLFLDKPNYTNYTSPLNDYSNNFNDISKKLKEKLGWKCQSCGFILNNNGMKQYLHAHHINGQKNDNREENLKIICLKCHAEEDGHGHMKNEKYWEFIQIKKTFKN